MIKAALIGLGKMGISHQAIITAHPDVKLVAVCDAASYVLALMEKYTGVKTYSDYQNMIDTEELDCVFIATPSRFHGEMVRYAIDHNLHVFCEKPFCLDLEQGSALAQLAEKKRLVTQVGYHCRFVGAFREARRLADSNTLGGIYHVQVEAYGPVVVRTKGSTWRHSKTEGGGCLYDYACHAIDLVHYVVGVPHSVGGTVVKSIFSRDVDDEVYSTFYFENGVTGQLAANWSDDSYRKMFTRITLWGTKGRLSADRQECQIYLREPNKELSLDAGWTIKNTVELTEPVSYYLRGEEYSAQIDHFIKSVKTGNHQTESTFRSALATDRVVQMLLADAKGRWIEFPKNSGTVAAKRRSVLQNLFLGKR
jgi:scyllo-inositol 2-dehydrogenase (NADP+)